MSIGSRIKEARERLGLTRTSLAGKLGITASAISNYENSISSPKIELLYKLMSELKVDANYLYQDEMQNCPTASLTDNLTKEQREYVGKYTALNLDGRERVHATINFEYAKQQGAKKSVTPIASATDNIIEFPRETVTLTEPSLPVCAGTGNYLDDGIEYTERTVLKNKYTYGADYIIRLQGNSMEPEFHDGDRLIVTDARGQSPINGRVGIFIVNGDAFLRQPINGKLHAYNSEYNDIVIHDFDAVRYVGYVVGIIDDSWVIE